MWANIDFMQLSRFDDAIHPRIRCCNRVFADIYYYRDVNCGEMRLQRLGKDAVIIDVGRSNKSAVAATTRSSPRMAMSWLRKKAQVDVKSTQPDDLAELLKKADAARESGDSKSAIDFYARALAPSPNDLYALFWLA